MSDEITTQATEIAGLVTAISQTLRINLDNLFTCQRAVKEAKRILQEVEANVIRRADWKLLGCSNAEERNAFVFQQTKGESDALFEAERLLDSARYAYERTDLEWKEIIEHRRLLAISAGMTALL